MTWLGKRMHSSIIASLLIFPPSLNLVSKENNLARTLKNEKKVLSKIEQQNYAIQIFIPMKFKQILFEIMLAEL